jgi:hypothetical protein
MLEREEQALVKPETSPGDRSLGGKKDKVPVYPGVKSSWVQHRFQRLHVGTLVKDFLLVPKDIEEVSRISFKRNHEATAGC